MDRETARDLLPAYALGVLDDSERRDLESLLADWPEARRDLAELRQTADLLPYVLEAQRPPLGLEGRIIAQARAQRAPGRRPQPVRRPAGVRRLTRFAPQALAAAFAAVAVVFGILAFDDSAPIDTEGYWSSIAGADPARAYIALNDQRQPVTLMFKALPPLPEGSVYQLWLLPADTNTPIPGPTFTPNPMGWAALVLTPAPAGPLEGFALTIEPEGGSATPTLPAFTFPTHE